MKLQKELIVTKALEILDRDGLDGVTQRKIAKELGVAVSALYWYFDNRMALIDEMAETILQSEFAMLVPRKDDEFWQDWLIEIMQRLRHAMLSHRDGARVVTGAHIYPAVTLGTIAETCMKSLHGAGLDVRQARLVSLTAINFTFGQTIEEQESPNEKELQKPSLQVFMKDFRKNYPLMMAAMQEASNSKRSADDDFIESLRLIVR